MSARRKSIHGPATTAATAPTPGRSTEAVAGPSSGHELEDTRAKWVQDRQEELDRVFDRHDTLVRMTTAALCVPTLMSFRCCVQIREVFHLEKFVTLLSYDPQVSLVFMLESLLSCILLVQGRSRSRSGEEDSVVHGWRNAHVLPHTKGSPR